MNAPILYDWFAIWRCDQEEHFCTESHMYYLPTTVLSEAAKIIEDDIGSRGTLMHLGRKV